MLLVIAGAGASYDAVPDTYSFDKEFQLPLTNNLFTGRALFRDILALFPTAKPLVARLIPSPSDDSFNLEDRLKAFADSVLAHEPREGQLRAVQFYIQQVIGRCEMGLLRSQGVPTNMDSLVDLMVERDPTHSESAFVTFNYDTLIERACRTNFQTEYGSMADYIEPGRIPIFKLHGSIDWVNYLEYQTQSNDELSRVSVWGNDVCWDHKRYGVMRKVEWCGTTVTNVSMARRFLPALAVPTRSKKFICPDSHIRRLETILPHVDRVLTIGWRGMEDHFADLLAQFPQRSVEVFSIAGPGTSKHVTNIRNRMIKVFRTISVVVKPMTFTQSIWDGSIQGFLQDGLRYFGE